MNRGEKEQYLQDYESLSTAYGKNGLPFFFRTSYSRR